jgi:chromosome segregation protein
MLKSLELFGFKSFADKTKFDFSSGVTAVVGPNGSGKSNVVDAIKWLLGDQSAKSLRGKEMVDVVFNGSASRKPSGFAEATLTFDNSQMLLPVESEELQIGRRIWRNGESEYLINRESVRLKDVRNLFMGTGAGRSAYAIIEQGRVDQILQATSSTRRLVFEDAAGISRYKTRRIEAERKLERVEQNLLRLTDIVDEVDSQLSGLRSQAVKVARYRELSDELRSLWVGLAADDFRILHRQLEQLDHGTDSFDRQLAELNTRQQDMESSLGGLDQRITNLDERLRDTEHQHAAQREATARHESTIRHQRARWAELESDLVRLRRQAVIHDVRCRQVQDELTQLHQVLIQHEEEHKQAGLELQQSVATVSESTQQLEQDRKQLEDQRQKLIQRMRDQSECGGRVSNLELQIQSAEESRQRAVEQQAAADDHIAAARDTLRSSQRAYDGRQREHAAAREELNTTLENGRALLESRDRLQETLGSLREKRSAAQARKSVLQDLETRQEGLGVDVQEILKRAETMDQPPWNGILGSVADLLDVELDQAALLDVALADRARLIVVRDWENWVDYLEQKARFNDRVGFLAFETQNSDRTGLRRDSATQSPPEALPDLSQESGVVQRADALAQAHASAPGLEARLLADTWIVETLETARRLAREFGSQCRFVTLQGELLEADGVLFTGPVQHEWALVSRKSELRRLKVDLQTIDQQIVEQQQQQGQLAESLENSDQGREALQDELQQRLDQLIEAQTAHERRQQELERRVAQRADLVAQERDAVSQRDTLEDQWHQAQAEFGDGEAQIEQIQEFISGMEQGLTESEQRSQGVEIERTRHQSSLAKQEERLHGVQTASERLQQDLQQRHRERKEAYRRLDAAHQKIRDASLQILNVRGELSEFALCEQRLRCSVMELLLRKDTLRQERAALIERDATLRQERRELSEQKHGKEMVARDLRHRLSTVESRIREEYQLELSDEVEAGSSAYAQYENSDAEEPSDSDFESMRPQIEGDVERLRRKLKHLGHVGTDSLNNLDDLETRFSQLNCQLQDLVEAKHALEEIIRRVSDESKRMFVETFDLIRIHFQDLFRKLFGGGEGDVILEDPDDVLECSVDIVARPPGKELRALSLLSGGEKTLTAVALLLAIFKSRPSPFCILDEVDAALDDANVDRFIGVVREFQETTQFVLITHRKPTMTVADTLYGVTMEESGVSKRLSVKFEDISASGTFITGDDGPGQPQKAA